MNHSIFYFNKESISKEENELNNNLLLKIYTILPNINFELTQIKSISFSNTNLNKYLVNRNFILDEIKDDSEYKSGFITMSQNHRIITLKNDIKECRGIKNSKNLKQIIFGIWLNFKEEKTSPKKIDLNFLLDKNKNIIYQKCFEFIQLSDNIETIFSPSPDENIFLLIIFYYGIQCQYEVKVIPNEEEKKDDDSILSNFKNNWLITKKKFKININDLRKYDFEYDLTNEIENVDKINKVNDFIINKIESNQRIFFSKSLNNKLFNKNKQNNDFYSSRHNLRYSKIIKDNLNEIFENTVNLSLDDDTNDFYDLYNLPMSINKNLKTEANDNYENNHLKIQKKINSISNASTSIQSNKPSLSLSKNSNNNNFINDDISHPYSSIIIEQGEKIKKLKYQVDRIEKTLLEVLKELDENNSEIKEIKNDNIYKKNKYKRIKKNNISEISNSNSRLIDQSIKVPNIVYKELSKEDEE